MDPFEIIFVCHVTAGLLVFQKYLLSLDVYNYINAQKYFNSIIYVRCCVLARSQHIQWNLKSESHPSSLRIWHSSLAYVSVVDTSFYAIHVMFEKHPSTPVYVPLLIYLNFLFSPIFFKPFARLHICICKNRAQNVSYLWLLYEDE